MKKNRLFLEILIRSLQRCKECVFYEFSTHYSPGSGFQHYNLITTDRASSIQRGHAGHHRRWSPGTYNQYVYPDKLNFIHIAMWYFRSNLFEAHFVSDITYWNDQILFIKNCLCFIQADITVEDNVGYQALHQAAQAGCIESVKFLIDSIGLSPNTISSRGFAPLSVAAKVNIFMNSLRLSSNSVPRLCN